MMEIMNLRNKKPSEKWDFILDRTSSLGNPYRMKSEEDRDLVCDKYQSWFDDGLRQGFSYWRNESETIILVLDLLTLLEATYRHYGKLRLFCWCAPKRCHTETIKNYILKNLKEKDGED